MKIEIISGSPRKVSVTNRLALYLHKLLSEKTGHEVGLIDMREHDLPMIQSVYSSPEKAPAEHRELAERMFAADAFVVVTPEYNSSFSPAMKNLFDHFPKQMHKTFGIVTASVGALGGMRAAQQMLLLTAGLFGIASPNLLVTPFVDKKFDADGNLVDESFQGSIDTFMHEFLWLAERVAANADVLN
ncbi:NAD(P)H-dependent FMN reductase [Mucilaginibacter yixingensis]|uniref:NAD(P)H-dependent FMN reductase n=1 Tax=Mucilaginibacter yixingensis TaxID=1295612 RepID=A0A2T5J8G5_9SPHI|nr:NAD(P)H-dependent oxidoreductase [Mucilaginibacter yixingensis]PTQ95684.1 NAD(P)H-dependent FMN reductase [Mucilaginibacter yixingensis]